MVAAGLGDDLGDEIYSTRDLMRRGLHNALVGALDD
jgi:hypothetical protein